jgi:hypothetical protein
MTEPLPPLRPEVMQAYVQARMDGLLERMIMAYWQHDVDTEMLLAQVGGLAELRALVGDVERAQGSKAGEVLPFSGEGGRRIRYGRTDPPAGA